MRILTLESRKDNSCMLKYLGPWDRQAHCEAFSAQLGSGALAALYFDISGVTEGRDDAARHTLATSDSLRVLGFDSTVLGASSSPRAGANPSAWERPPSRHGDSPVLVRAERVVHRLKALLVSLISLLSIAGFGWWYVARPAVGNVAPPTGGHILTASAAQSVPSQIEWKVVRQGRDGRTIVSVSMNSQDLAAGIKHALRAQGIAADRLILVSEPTTVPKSEADRSGR